MKKRLMFVIAALLIAVLLTAYIPEEGKPHPQIVTPTAMRIDLPNHPIQKTPDASRSRLPRQINHLPPRYEPGPIYWIMKKVK